MSIAAQRIIERAKRLPARERRRVVAVLAASLNTSGHSPVPRPARTRSYVSLIALAGTAHSDLADVSRDKYAHLAAAYSDDDV
ncbi:MAG: hypothetical protein ABSF69_21725 [Polyangiaceae bacterium]|jgi:hypothetical protein